MARIVCIDYGSKRTGLAVTDTQQIIANPLVAIPTWQLEDFLKKYFAEEDVETVVVGMPTKLDGSDTNATQLVKAFITKFKKKFPEKKLVLHDERYTSKMALDAMIMGGLNKKKRRDKGTIDKVSATIILQSFLEQRG